MQAAVGHPVGASSGIQSLTPQHPEITFARFAIAVGPILALHGCVFGVTEEFRAASAITFRFSQNPASPFATGRCVCCSWHFVVPNFVRASLQRAVLII